MIEVVIDLGKERDHDWWHVASIGVTLAGSAVVENVGVGEPWKRPAARPRLQELTRILNTLYHYCQKTTQC